VVPLRVPKRAVPRLRDLAGLTDDQASELLAALEKVTPVVSRQSLSVRLQTPLPHLDKTQSEELISVLFNLWAVSASHNWDLHDVAETAAQDTSIDIPEDKRAGLAARLYSALELRSVADTANAADIATEYDAIFHLARCFTDVRPVFQRAPESEVSGAVIVHNLKIDYFTSSGSQSLTLTLSGEDVERLTNTLNDTKKERSRLSEVLKASGLRLFEFSEHLGRGNGDQD
jgi:hypothetical protein